MGFLRKNYSYFTEAYISLWLIGFITAEFTFSKYYQDHMVLQKSATGTSIWGHSTKVGDTIRISIDNHVVSHATVNTHGIWQAKFKSPNGNGPHNITASSALGSIHITDVLFGDVWFCSGQSNMDFPLSRLINASLEESDALNYPNLRMFKDSKNASTVLDEEIPNIAIPWSTADNRFFKYFSAVCWLYGKYLYQHLNYPIGLVQSSWGGTRIEAWSSSDAIAACNTTSHKRKVDRNAQSVLFKGMVSPHLRNTIKGVIWYQGESNAGHAADYTCQFPAMIQDWRAKFHNASLGTTSANFPFGFVQIAPNKALNRTCCFPDIRWAQTANYGYVPNAKLPNVFMAVTIDLPDFSSPYGTIHPRIKHDVALRLVLSSLGVAYRQKGVEFQGPFPTAFHKDDIHHTISIEYGNGVTPISIRDNEGFDACCTTVHHGPKCYTWIPAHIKSHSLSNIVVDISNCTGYHIVTAVRYAWLESPCKLRGCAVYGRDTDLPAAPFVHYL